MMGRFDSASYKQTSSHPYPTSSFPSHSAYPASSSARDYRHAPSYHSPDAAAAYPPDHASNVPQLSPTFQQDTQRRLLEFRQRKVVEQQMQQQMAMDPKVVAFQQALDEKQHLQYPSGGFAYDQPSEYTPQAHFTPSPPAQSYSQPQQQQQQQQQPHLNLRIDTSNSTTGSYAKLDFDDVRAGFPHGPEQQFSAEQQQQQPYTGHQAWTPHRTQYPHNYQNSPSVYTVDGALSAQQSPVPASTQFSQAQYSQFMQYESSDQPERFEPDQATPFSNAHGRTYSGSFDSSASSLPHTPTHTQAFAPSPIVFAASPASYQNPSSPTNERFAYDSSSNYTMSQTPQDQTFQVRDYAPAPEQAVLARSPGYPHVSDVGYGRQASTLDDSQHHSQHYSDGHFPIQSPSYAPPAPAPQTFPAQFFPGYHAPQPQYHTHNHLNVQGRTQPQPHIESPPPPLVPSQTHIPPQQQFAPEGQIDFIPPPQQPQQVYTQQQPQAQFTSGYAPQQYQPPPPPRETQKPRPVLACLFCRHRKIACGASTGDDKRCNQCARRQLVCEYPTECRRGLRKGRKTSQQNTVDEKTAESTSR